MAALKCKMCGGNLDVQEGMTVVECEYCGSRQTVPVIDNEKKIKLFERANKLRAACEFDKAFGVYESIVAEYSEEAEAYWGLVLCKYGIEYVDDPADGKKIPTCHRSSFDSIMEDENFELVMENTDAVAMQVYREEAKKIEEIRKGIIEISARENAYDIFICYKETDENGDRTLDSVLAQDVYDALAEKGYRVFFSRVTLEDKLGQEYEPYIFSALNSAKVMLAFGTKYEYYNAVWVKNEWSRFIQMMSSGQKKTLIPCYKDIDAYDMPKEFAKLQAQDMGKVGAVQDLLRGIDKILGVEKKESGKANDDTNANANAVELLMKRVRIFLETKEWRNAIQYCERVLDIEPENAEAYVGKLMAELQVEKQEDLPECEEPFDDNKNYKLALTYADDELKKVLKGYSDECVYNKGLAVMNAALSEGDFDSAAQMFDNAAQIFRRILHYKDAEALAEECDRGIEKRIAEADQLMENYQRLQNMSDQAGKSELMEVKEKIKNIKIWSIINKDNRKWSVFYDDLEFLSWICKESDIWEKLPLKVRLKWAIEQGQEILFGSFWWGRSDRVPIKWTVLEKKDNKVFLQSLGSHREMSWSSSSHAGWHNSEICRELNGLFFENAFTEEEKKMIIEVPVEYHYDKAGLFGNKSHTESTTNRIFLLSIAEAHQYYGYMLNLKDGLQGTPHGFWLRDSLEDGSCSRAAVALNEFTGFKGNRIMYAHKNKYSFSVRPVLWIDLS